MKRLLVLLLAMLMTVSVFASCSDAKDDDTTADTTTAEISPEVSAETTVATVEENPLNDVNGYLKDTLEQTLNYGGKAVNILYWNDVERPEFEVKELTGDLVNDAIYNRNMTVESRLGINFNWIGTPGNYGNQANFVSAVGNDVSSGGEYNVFAGYSMSASTIALRGYSRDLMAVNNIDFEKPWWPVSLTGQATINDHLYFCSGDISTNILHMMYCVEFNKTLAEKYSYTELYNDVRNGKWTLDKMMEYSSGMYIDLDGDGLKSTAADQFGFMTSDLHLDAFYTGCGLKTLEKDADDNLIISPDFASSKTQDLLVKLADYLTKDYCDSTGTASTNPDVAALSQGRTLFDMTRTYVASWEMMKRVSDYQYGILPVPKYDEAQEDYITCMAFPYTLYSVSYAISEELADMTGAVLECMASEGYRQVSPALFETTMKLKYATGEDDSDMYDITRRCIYIDLGRIFSTDLQDITYLAFRNTAKAHSTNWTSVCKSYSKMLDSKLKGVNKTLSERAG